MVIENEMRAIVADMVPRLGNNNTTNNTVNIHVFLNENVKCILNRFCRYT